MQEKVLSVLRKAADKWKSFERSQQIKIISIAVIFFVVLSIAIYLAVKPKMYTLVSNQDAITIMNAQNSLDEAGIQHKIANNGTALEVRKQDAGEARLQLESQNVFSGAGAKFTYHDALEYSTMGTTDTIKNENLKKAKQTELEETLVKMKGINEATVHLVIPNDSNFFLPDNTASASVFLVTEGKLEPEQAETVARLIQRSVKNLELENIEVTDQNYNMLFSGVAIDTDNGLKTRYDAELLMKNALETQIKKAAAPMYKETNTILNLVFNWDTIQEKSTEYINPIGDDSNSGFIDTNRKHKSDYSNASPEAEPGVAANDQQTPTYLMGNENNSSASINESEANYIYNIIEKVKEGGIGELISANSSAAVIVYRYVDHSEEYMTENNRLGGGTWTDFKQNTIAKEFSVDDSFVTALRTGTGIPNLSVAGFEIPVFHDKVVQPLQIEHIVMLVILGLLILLLAYGLLRRTQPDEVTEIEPELSVEDLLVSSQLEEMEEAGSEKLRNIELGLESEVKRQIEKFIDEKPEAAAQLLRNWLNEDWE